MNDEKAELAFFVTNRHVVDIEYNDSRYCESGYKLSSLQLRIFDRTRSDYLRTNNVVITTPRNRKIDIAMIMPFSISKASTIKALPIQADFSEGKEQVTATKEFLEEELEWGCQVSFSSFQPWRDAQTERPILRTGILSSDPAHPIVIDGIDRSDLLLLEAMSFGGSSGSPVFANARGIIFKEGAGIKFNLGTDLTHRRARLIGIMTGHISNKIDASGVNYGSHTGLSFCHRADVLFSMAGNIDVEHMALVNGRLKRAWMENHTWRWDNDRKEH